MYPTKKQTASKYERILKLDNNKLIDVVKNYRQYGYDEELRETAMNILADRGISKDQLKFTGNLGENTYDFAKGLCAAYLKNSRIAFVLYLALFILRISNSLFHNAYFGFESTLLIVTIILFILFVMFLILSFVNQNQFYKSIGQEYVTEAALLYLLLGMSFYIFMYFYFRRQMSEKIKDIR